MILPPLNFKKWIEEHRNQFKPPVGNMQVWPDREFMITLVGGPNNRTDFHINEGEEFFYQIEGDVTLRLLDNEKFVDLILKEGDIFLLPPRIPHSPQRPANTLGMVIERRRFSHEKDGFIWFCQNCHKKLYEEFIHLKDIVKDLPVVFNHYFGDPSHYTCRHCHTVNKK